MANYYANKKVKENGDHEVHKDSCVYLPEREDRVYLGGFIRCRPAIKKAKEYYKQVNGCYYCSRQCLTN